MEQNYQQQSSNQPRGHESLPNATLILVLGILSIIFCQPLGIAAWVMGNNSISMYEQQPERYSESSLGTVKAGRICGIIGVCIMGILIILMLAGVSIFSLFAFNNR